MQSFSEKVKEELYKYAVNNICCVSAEFAGVLMFGCSVSEKEIRLCGENKDVLERFLLLCRRLNINAKVLYSAKASQRYNAVITDFGKIAEILREYDLIGETGRVVKYKISPHITENECCKSAFMRGVFLGGGTVINPVKNYNLEIITPYMNLNRDLNGILSSEGFAFKSVVRKSKYVLYTKNSETICDFLTYIGAYKSQMELINIKIEKEIRNDFNRTVNSENANLDKTIGASVKQVQAIQLIDEKEGLENLPEDLYEIAKLRLSHRSQSLSELGKMLNPPLGKSGVNHRIKRILDIAEKYNDTKRGS